MLVMMPMLGFMMLCRAGISSGRDIPASKMASDVSVSSSHIESGTLGIVASGRSDYRVVRRQQLIEPLLDGGLAARTGDAHHRYVEAAPVGAGEILQCSCDARHEQDDGVGSIGHVVGYVARNEVAHSAVVELSHVAVSVVVAGADGEEQRLCGIGQRTAVGQQYGDFIVGIGRRREFGMDDLGYP